MFVLKILNLIDHFNFQLILIDNNGKVIDQNDLLSYICQPSFNQSKE
jgi:hypothetical protein